MKKEVYDRKIDETIVAHEEQMLQKYSDEIDKLSFDFSKIGYSVEISLSRIDRLNNRMPLSISEFRNGYECFVSFEVRKDNQLVVLPGYDGEADYYEMRADWQISMITRKFFKTYVLLFDEVDVEEIKEDISIIWEELTCSRNEYSDLYYDVK